MINPIQKVFEVVYKFINDNNIYCAETIYQTDRIIENAYELIHELCEIVGYKEYQDDE